MMGGGVFARSLGNGVRRLAARAPVPVAQPLLKPVLRPLSVLSTPAWQRMYASVPKFEQTPKATPSVAPMQLPQNSSLQQVAEEACKASQATTSMLKSARDKSMVFEIGLSFTVLHYQSIFIGVMRCVFQAFRPLLILFVFGQILKAVFFIAGAPIWMSFYSIWIFEVGYGLAQCAISFIFISFFYNNLSFARIRPTLTHYLRSQRDKLARTARAISGGSC
mmetsp:Transcript_18321/g.32472  ORF Transcript_18321/g.32472 Transcript_18321/m.32472 type:complete len:221 (+) Transcript_18321:57-719(+)